MGVVIPPNMDTNENGDLPSKDKTPTNGNGKQEKKTAEFKSNSSILNTKQEMPSKDVSQKPVPPPRPRPPSKTTPPERPKRPSRPPRPTQNPGNSRPRLASKETDV